MPRLFICGLVTLALMWGQEGEKRVAPVEGQGRRRLALVIGNRDYKDKNLVRITPAYEDAHDVDVELQRLGFLVSVRHDMTLERLITEVDTFRQKVQPGDLALIYYSGHGVQLDEENYLLPVDYAPPSRESKELFQRRAYKISTMRDEERRSDPKVL